MGVEHACRSVLWMPGVLSNEIFDVIDVMAHCGGFIESVVSASMFIGVGVFMQANSSMLFLKNDVKKIFVSPGGVSGLKFVCGNCSLALISVGLSRSFASFLTFFLRTAF